MLILKSQPQKHLLIYCLAAVIPLFLMGLLFNFPLLLGHSRFFPGTSRIMLGSIIQTAFLAAASGILPLIPLLINIRRNSLRWLPKIIFAVLGFACAWLAYEFAGTAGMLFYVVLVFVTFGGGTLFIFDWLFGVTRTFLTLLRWSVALFTYVSLQLHMDLDVNIANWKESNEAIRFGAGYFYILCLLEVFLYPPLTWHLERRLRFEQNYSVALDGFGKQHA